MRPTGQKSPLKVNMSGVRKLCSRPGEITTLNALRIISLRQLDTSLRERAWQIVKEWNLSVCPLQSPEKKYICHQKNSLGKLLESAVGTGQPNRFSNADWWWQFKNLEYQSLFHHEHPWGQEKFSIFWGLPPSRLGVLTKAFKIINLTKNENCKRRQISNR